jgi:hypothetical protein
MSFRLFLSHDSRDTELAKVIATTLSRITLGQLDVWFSSDDSPSGGIRPGRVWLDEIRSQLQMSKAIIVLLTPTSLSKPWILFESGFGASITSCEIIPLCVGINTLRDVPFPLAMFQCYQLADYESLKNFSRKLLQLYEINFDEEMSSPVLAKAITEFTKIIPSKEETHIPSKEETHIPYIQKNFLEFVESIKQHFDKRFLELVEKQEVFGIRKYDKAQKYIPTLYTIPILINFPDFQRTQYLDIESDTTVQDVLNNIYYMLDDKVEAFTYLQRWILRETKTNVYMIIREVTAMIPARFVFTPNKIWEAIELKSSYKAEDSSDIDRWYQ